MENTQMNKNKNNHYYNESSIIQMNTDHLFSILLLLPIKSILSFSVTCKKFRSLSCSNTVWEAVCRRDWGSSSLEALKTQFCDYHQKQEIVWMRMYMHVFMLDSVSCKKLCEGDCELILPGPRASHSLNFVSDCLVLFGGGCEGGRHLDDTWVAYIGNNFQTKLKWQKITSSSPSGRFGHTCVVIEDSLVLFGGINDNGIRQNDTWVGKITRHETPGIITLSWKLLDVMGPLSPPARGAHTACFFDNNKMIIHGGIGLHALRLGDTWVLDLSNCLSSGTWREILIHPSPPARSGHTLTCIGGTTKSIVLFGGRGEGYEVLGDVWLLKITKKYANWVQIIYERSNIPGGVSLPRVGHSATSIIGGGVLIYGGEDSYRNRKEDFWVLDVNAVEHMWRRMKIKGHVPKGRSFHRACKDRSGRFVYFFGGMVDGVISPAEALGLRFDGELFVAEFSLQL